MIYLIGLGAIGKSFLVKIIELRLAEVNQIICVDSNIENRDYFVKVGCDINHYFPKLITEENYLNFLSDINEGDYLFDFATEIKNLDILQYVYEHGIHYMFLADSSWNQDPKWISLHQHFLEYKRLKEKLKGKKFPTIISEFGMNPGMVSIFVKKCLEEIVTKDDGKYVSHNRKRLVSLVKEKKWGNLAKRLGVEYIIEVDNDDQIFDVEPEDNTIYSPWCPEAYRVESLSAPELAFADKKQFYQFDEVFDCDFKDNYIALKKPAISCNESFYSPQGRAVGHLTSHEEVFTINDYFSYGNYKATTLFLYSPCDIAISSVENNKLSEKPNFKLLLRENLVSGGESVGIILQGKRFSPRYYGNLLESCREKETATVLQVSGSAVAAFQYMINHPNEGLLFPEDLDENEILNLSRKYLKDFISCECPSIKLNYGVEKG